MPRRLRIYMPGLPQQVTQRGNNGQITFASDADRAFYLECLEDAAGKYCCEVHAYVLMANHVHLLVTPRQQDSISRLMQSVGRRYVQHVNYTYHRTGTLWEGRHQSALVDTDEYLLRCYRYIELNPVRARIVEHPGKYRWSSYGHHAEGRFSPVVSEHPQYLALGRTQGERRTVYRELLSRTLDAEVIEKIRKATRFGLVIGRETFTATAEATLRRRLRPARRGRPLKATLGASRHEHVAFAEGIK
jgi:putative transposase